MLQMTLILVMILSGATWDLGDGEGYGKTRQDRARPHKLQVTHAVGILFFVNERVAVW